MTSNQLSYLNLERQKQTDAATIKETRRHNIRGENLTRAQNRENKRHNLIIEGNQQNETQAGILRAQLAAQASKYSADASAQASKYSADKSYQSTKYAADSSSEANKYASDRNAQTTMAVAYLNKQIQAAKDAVNKAINDDNINARQKENKVKIASDQFLKELERNLKKYEIQVNKKIKDNETRVKLADLLMKGAKNSQIFELLISLGAISQSQVKQVLKDMK